MTLTDDSQQCQWATRGGDLGLPVRESEPAAITAAAASRKIHLNNTYQDDIKVCNKHLKWDINDTTLPMAKEYDNFQMWPSGHSRHIYPEKLEEVRRHCSGWAMRNTNNHNVKILKKSCLGVLVCSVGCTRENGEKVNPRPAICDKARKKQLGKPCPNPKCTGRLELRPCRGHCGYPVTHFWRRANGAVYFQSKGSHDHPKPDLKPSAHIKRHGALSKRVLFSRNSRKRPAIKGRDMCSCPQFECTCPHVKRSKIEESKAWSQCMYPEQFAAAPPIANTIYGQDRRVHASDGLTAIGHLLHAGQNKYPDLHHAISGQYTDMQHVDNRGHYVKSEQQITTTQCQFFPQPVAQDSLYSNCMYSNPATPAAPSIIPRHPSPEYRPATTESSMIGGTNLASSYEQECLNSSKQGEYLSDYPDILAAFESSAGQNVDTLMPLIQTFNGNQSPNVVSMQDEFMNSPPSGDSDSSSLFYSPHSLPQQQQQQQICGTSFTELKPYPKNASTQQLSGLASDARSLLEDITCDWSDGAAVSFTPTSNHLPSSVQSVPTSSALVSSNESRDSPDLTTAVSSSYQGLYHCAVNYNPSINITLTYKQPHVQQQQQQQQAS